MRTWTYAIILSLLLPLFSHAQDIYTWEDQSGVIHFSEDTPPPSATEKQKLRLPDIKAAAPAPVVVSAQPLSARKAAEKQPTAAELKRQSLTATSQSARGKESKKAQENKLLDIKIATPAHEQTIRSNRGRITIVLEANRSLKPDERYQLLMNGKRYGAPKTDPVWELTSIDRGTHHFSVNALQSGKVIASTSTIKVHLHRNSVKK